MEVDFGPVEGPVAIVDLIVYPFVLEGGFEGTCSGFPDFIGADVFFRLRGKL